MEKMTFGSCREAGFTMLELVVVVSVVAILMAVAFPSFKVLSMNTARANGGTLLLSTFNQARGEAIARGTSVFVCPRAYFATGSVPSCDSSATNWEQGWIIYYDSTGNGGTTLAVAADVLGVFEPLGTVFSGGNASTATNKDAFFIVSSLGATPVQYQSGGRPAKTATFTICDQTQPQPLLTDSRRVEIAPSGGASLRSMNTACPS